MQPSGELKSCTTVWRSSYVMRSVSWSSPLNLNLRVSSIRLNTSRPRYAKLGSLDLRNFSSNVSLAFPNILASSDNLVENTALMSSISTLLAFGYDNMFKYVAVNLGSRRASALLISLRTLINFIMSQLDFVLSISSNRAGIVMRKRRGLTIVIF